MKPSKKQSSETRIMRKVNDIMRESSAVPFVSAARTDPPPVSVSKSLWIARKIRISKTVAPGALVTVADVKAESSGNMFKIKKIEAWLPGRWNVKFTLGNNTWINDSAIEMSYSDAAPPSRAPGVKFNIPDQLAEIMGNNDAAAILTAVPLSTAEGLPGASLVCDCTIMYQI